jgi:hypothetical protein
MKNESSSQFETSLMTTMVYMLSNLKLRQLPCPCAGSCKFNGRALAHFRSRKSSLSDAVQFSGFLVDGRIIVTGSFRFVMKDP